MLPRQLPHRVIEPFECQGIHPIAEQLLDHRIVALAHTAVLQGHLLDSDLQLIQRLLFLRTETKLFAGLLEADPRIWNIMISISGVLV